MNRISLEATEQEHSSEIVGVIGLQQGCCTGRCFCCLEAQPLISLLFPSCAFLGFKVTLLSCKVVQSEWNPARNRKRQLL